MKKNVFLLLIVCAVFNFMSFMSFATSFDYELPVPDANVQSVTPNLIGCGGGSTINPEDLEDADTIPVIEEEETYVVPQTTVRYTSEEDPLYIVEVDAEGNEKEIHLPYPDATIDYDRVDYKKAKYHYSDDALVINYGNDTYVVSGKDDLGFYTKVTENGKEYSIDRYQKIAGIDDYVYKGKEYEVDEDGYMVAYRREWVLSEHRDYDGERIGNYEDTKLLFRKEVPFNILWRHRPLSEEEKELLYTGPGVGLKGFSTGLSEDGSARVVSKRKPEEASVEDTKVDYVKKKVVVIDPMDPMKAKSVKKKKKNED
ncbi:MAG: hypothetical protein IKP66_09470 [Lachnospiraceae bacterium]|nr:hypothetical protein [Lachnospiraceae bacterium]